MASASTTTPMTLPLVIRKTRAYFAPVNRATRTPTIYDPAVHGTWNLTAPPAPWVDLGWVTGFARNAETVLGEVWTGAPGVLRLQTRQRLGAVVRFQFATWSKLSMALGTGSEHMNVLTPVAVGNAAPVGSGGAAAAAVALGANSTSTVLYASGTTAAAGSLLVVDVDYAGQTGFVGTAVSGAYVENASAVGGDVDYVRRVSFNVGRVTAVGSDGGLQLALPLPAGAPAAGMKLQTLVGFVDREAGSYFPEWSALFVCEGVQGERLCFHYPRLQPAQSAAERVTSLTPELDMVQPEAAFRAMPVRDANDGAPVVCYRSFYPAAMTMA